MLTFSVQSEALLGPLALTADSVTVKFSQTKLTVGPGKSGTITAEFTPPKIDGAGLPAYSGHIEIKSSSETLRVSYMGIVGSVRAKQLLDRSNATFGVPVPFIGLPDGSVQNTTTKYTFSDGDFPTIVFRYGSFAGV